MDPLKQQATIALCDHKCSKKFWRKVHFISTLQDLSGHVQLQEEYVSAPVAAMDKLIMSRRPASHKYITVQEPSATTANKPSATTTADKPGAVQEPTTTTADMQGSESLDEVQTQEDNAIKHEE